MTTPIHCPLCGGAEHETADVLSYDDIRHIYRQVYRIDIPATECRTIHLLACNDCDLRFYWPQIVGSPSLYEQLQQFDWYYLQDKEEFRLASKVIKPNSSVLEIGCGAGAFSDFLPSGCSYKGLEYNAEAIRKARSRGLDVSPQDIESFAESAESTFDVVCSFQVLEHVDSPAKFLQCAVRALAPGGILIIAVPSEDSFLSEEVNNVLNMPPHHLTRWTNLALRNITQHIRGIEFSTIEHESISDFNMPSLARAKLFTVSRRLGLRIPTLSRVATTAPFRAVVKLLSIPIVRFGIDKKNLPTGHTVVSSYTKSFGDRQIRSGRPAPEGDA